jgi:predicted XRE-type DNA-binding protein
MQIQTTKLQETLTHIHLCVQLIQKKRLSYAEMASLAGVSQRTFAEWMRGACSPSAVEAVLKMLALLPNEEIAKAIEVWRTPVPVRRTRPSRIMKQQRVRKAEKRD